MVYFYVYEISIGVVMFKIYFMRLIFTILCKSVEFTPHFFLIFRLQVARLYLSFFKNGLEQ